MRHTLTTPRPVVQIYWSGATVSDNVQRIYGAYTKDFKTVSKPFLYYTEGHTGVADLTLLKLSKGKDAWVRFWRSDVHGLQVLGESDHAHGWLQC